MRRFYIRPHQYATNHFEITEVVSDTPQFGTLTIKWDGLHSTIETAVARIETELGVYLVAVPNSHYEPKKIKVRPKLRLA